jgi:hypothetical protein
VRHFNNDYCELWIKLIKYKGGHSVSFKFQNVKCYKEVFFGVHALRRRMRVLATEVYIKIRNIKQKFVQNFSGIGSNPYLSIKWSHEKCN